VPESRVLEVFGATACRGTVGGGEGSSALFTLLLGEDILGDVGRSLDKREARKDCFLIQGVTCRGRTGERRRLCMLPS
jgi:hypothetical protein